MTCFSLPSCVVLAVMAIAMGCSTEPIVVTDDGSTTDDGGVRDDGGTTDAAASDAGGSSDRRLRLGGNVTGLLGGELVLSDGRETLVIEQAGDFQFSNYLAPGTAYAVSIVAHPEHQLCILESGAGTVDDANPNLLSITCVAPLSSLRIRGADLSPAFAPALMEYEVAVPSLRNHVEIEAVAGDPQLQIRIDGDPVANNIWRLDAIPSEPEVTTLEVALGDAVRTVQLRWRRADASAITLASTLRSPLRDSEIYSFFGHAVALDGDLMAIGMLGDASLHPSDPTDTSGERVGAVHIYQRTADGWIPIAYVKAPEPRHSGAFGTSVALAGDTLIVGEPYYGGDRPGAVYAFRSVDGDWIAEATLRATHRDDASDRFGARVDLSEDRIVVGAEQEDRGRGRVYIYRRQRPGQWILEDYLRADVSDEQDSFGWDVAISGTTVVATAPGEDSGRATEPGDNTVRESGAAYVFELIDGEWVQTQYLKADAITPLGTFGIDADLDGDTLVVGAAGDDSHAISGGAVYVFTADPGGQFVLRQNLGGSRVHTAAGLGTSVTLDGDSLLAGSFGHEAGPNRIEYAGAVYAYRRTAGNFAEVRMLESPAPTRSAAFGATVFLSSGIAIVTERGGDNYRGLVHVFQ